MVKRLSNASEMPESKANTSPGNESENYQRIKPFPKPSPAVLLIIAVIICFIGNVGYQTYDEFKIFQQKQKAKTKTCLMDFGKLNCNAVSPSQQCTPIIDCVMNNQQKYFQVLEIIIKQLEENFIAPSIMVGLLLIVRLCQLISEKKDKIM